MKNYLFVPAMILTLAGAMLLSGCTKDKDPQPEPGGGSAAVEIKTANDVDATVNAVYFNLNTGTIVEAVALTATNWDVKFSSESRNVKVSVNSGNEGTGTAGAQIVSVGFDDLKEAPAEGYKPGDEAMPDFSAWASYTGGATPAHAVLPKPGTTIVIKTATGTYAKIQMISLYKGNPNTSTTAFSDLSTRPAFGFFTFRYGTQTDGSRKF